MSSGGGTRREDAGRLRRTVEWALSQSKEQDELVRMLRRLAAISAPDSEDFRFAHRHLAELLVEREPWLAAISARHVIAQTPDDDGAWAVLGLAYTVLGHFRAAVSCYRRAAVRAPGNPWYAHNLGHLLDVTLDRPHEAVRLLERAHKLEPKNSEIATSYAHTLGRVGRPAEGRALLRRHIRGAGTAAERKLLEWLEKTEQEQAALAAREAPRKRRPRRHTS